MSSTRPASQRIAYGELADAAAKLPVPTDVKLKDPSAFRIIGTPAKRLDVAGKVDGTAVFGIDVKLPGMKIATVAASPVFGGTLASLDEAAALKVPGVHQVAKLDNAVAVIADHYWAARKGLEAAKPTFDDGPHASLTTADVVAALAKASETTGRRRQERGRCGGRAGKRRDQGRSDLRAPFLAHATMEPMNCTVQVTADGCDIWVGTQIPTVAQQAVAQTLGLKPEQVRIHNHLLGGGFGRRLEFDFIVQAALIAKQSKDPVKVVWSREEDIQHDMYRPYYYDRFSAGLDAQGMPIAWSHRIVGSSIMARFFPPAFKDGIDPDAVDGAIDMPYAIAEQARRIRARGASRHSDRVLARRRPDAQRLCDRELHRRAGGDCEKGPGRVPPRDARQESARPARARTARPKLPAGASRLADRTRPRRVRAQYVRKLHVAGRRGHGVEIRRGARRPRRVRRRYRRRRQSRYHRGADAERHHLRHHGRAVGRDHARRTAASSSRTSTTIECCASMRRRSSRSRWSRAAQSPGGIGEPGTTALAPAVLNAVYAATGVRLRKLPIKTDLLKST